MPGQRCRNIAGHWLPQNKEDMSRRIRSAAHVLLYFSVLCNHSEPLIRDALRLSLRARDSLISLFRIWDALHLSLRTRDALSVAINPISQ